MWAQIDAYLPTHSPIDLLTFHMCGRLLTWAHKLEDEATSTHGLAAQVGESLPSRRAFISP